MRWSGCGGAEPGATAWENTGPAFWGAPLTTSSPLAPDYPLTPDT